MDPPKEYNNENSKGVGKVKIKNMLNASYTFLKVGGDKKNVEKKDSRVKTNVKSYLRKLTESSTKHNKQKITIKENMQTISNSCLEEQQPTINRLPKINKVPQINHNNVGTKETLEQVREMHQYINQLQEVLERDNEDLANNLLFVYEQLVPLESLRDKTMQEASTALQDINNKLRSYFSRLDEFSHYFTNYLWDLSRILIPLAKRVHSSAIIASLAKIIEQEQVHSESSRLISNLLEQVHNSTIKSFEEKLQKYREQPVQLLDKLDFIYNDLNLVKNVIDPLFSSNYKILSFFVSCYHRNVYDYIQNVYMYIENNIQPELSAEPTLELITWVRHYYVFMEKEMNLFEDLMEPKLLGEQEQILINRHLNLLHSKFQEWKVNLMENDIVEFTQRQSRPELDSKETASLPGAPILISMIRQQIDLAIKSANYRLLTGVINECYEVLSEIQQSWINILESELRQHLDNQEGSTDGLVIYIIALANGQLGLVDFADVLSGQFTSSLPEEHTRNIASILDKIKSGSLNVATKAINTILDVIYNDLKKPLRELHTSRWYKGYTMDVIILTLEDYTTECHSHLKPKIFDELMTAMLNRFVIAYLESMRNKVVKFRMPHCIDKMRRDIYSISEFFTKYIGAKELSSQLDVIDKLHNFLGTSKESVYSNYYSLRKAYGDVPRKYLKIILSKRDDLSLSDMNKINKILKDKAVEAGEYYGKPTVFSKIIIKDSGATSVDELRGDIQEVFHRLKSLRNKK